MLPGFCITVCFFELFFHFFKKERAFYRDKESIIIEDNDSVYNGRRMEPASIGGGFRLKCINIFSDRLSSIQEKSAQGGKKCLDPVEKQY